jgi:hypothetical protein
MKVITGARPHARSRNAALHTRQNPLTGGSATLYARYTYSAMGHRISEQLDTRCEGGDAGNTGFPDGVVDAADPIFFIAPPPTDTSGRRLPPATTFRGTDEHPKETFIHRSHGVGDRIRGPIHQGGPILRDRNSVLVDKPYFWASEAADSERYERHYYLLDWRGQVSAIIASDGTLVEQVRYSAAGVPFNMAEHPLRPLGDVDADGPYHIKLQAGASGTADETQIKHLESPGPYHIRGDLDLDGDVDAADLAIATAKDGTKTGRGSTSTHGHERAARLSRHLARSWPWQPVGLPGVPFIPVAPPPPIRSPNPDGMPVPIDASCIPGCEDIVPFERWSTDYAPTTPVTDPLQWANYDFALHFQRGQGSRVDLSAVGLGDNYLAHPLIVESNVSQIVRALDLGRTLAHQSMNALRCNSRPQFDFRSSTNGFTDIIAGSFALPARHQMLNDPQFFWYQDWTFAIGGHQIVTTITCNAVSKCLCSACKTSSWSCTIDRNMIDTFTDVFGLGTRRARDLEDLLPGIVPGAGTRYLITYRWSFGVEGEIVRCD